MAVRPKYLIDSVSVPWFVTGMQLMSDTTPVTLQQLRKEAAEQGVDLGVRADLVTRLTDLGMVENPGSGFRLTNRGKALQDTLIRDTALFVEQLHQWHYARAFLPGAREYFTSYRLLIDAYWRNPQIETGQALSDIIKGIVEVFPAAVDQTGLSKATVGKGLVFWKYICGQVQRRSDAPVAALLYAVGVFGLARGYRVGEPILLSDSTRTELCHYLFLEPTALDSLIDRTLRMTRKLGDKTSLSGRSIYLLEAVATA